MTGKDRLEGEEIAAAELQKHMATAILQLEIEMPTVAFTKKKANLLYRDYSTATPHLTIQEIFEQGEWSANPAELDLLVWMHTESVYLPYVFGSFDQRRPGLNNTVMKYDINTFNKGMRIILLKLDKIYKVLKFRNPVYNEPKPKRIIDWKLRITAENSGNVPYYYRWSGNIYTVPSTPMISSSSSPSYHHINVLQERQPAFRYTLDTYDFIFLPMSKSKDVLPDLSHHVYDVSPLLYGRPLFDGEFWPATLKSVCFPMLAVEQMVDVYPVFKWLVEHKPQTNRQLKYYVLKEIDYRKFVGVNGLKGPQNATLILNGNVYGNDIVSTQTSVGMMMAEILVRDRLHKDWEEYEDDDTIY